jgi:tetratricopeptide (TPR) repeat protein
MGHREAFSSAVQIVNRNQCVAGHFACRARAAVDRTRRGLAEAEAAGHAYSITAAPRVLGLALLRRRDLAQAIPAAERAAELIRSGDFAVLSAWITGMLGSAYVLAGKLDEVLLPAGGGRRADAAMQVNIGDAAAIATLGEACLLSGRRAEATAHAERALKILRERRERDHEASALHLAGEIAAANADSGHRHLHSSRRGKSRYDLGMRPLRAHCNLALGRLHRRAGDREAARRILARRCAATARWKCNTG